MSYISFFRRAQVLRATGELVWCGCVRGSTSSCQDLTGTEIVFDKMSKGGKIYSYMSVFR